MEFPGPSCRAIQLSVDCVLQEDDPVGDYKFNLTNGAIFELKSLLDKNQKGMNELVHVIQRLHIDPNIKTVNPSSIRTKVVRLVNLKKKIVSKKKVAGFNNLEEFLSSKFTSPTPTQSFERDLTNNAENTSLIIFKEPVESIIETQTKPEHHVDTQTYSFEFEHETVGYKNLLQTGQKG
ncbi:hypothetical protein SNE40_018160 [Patella caerulea]|uniref:Uncharacterized protein n=1 Tax=Patella caerulea TaxID=87958 RepID=A0AAN8J761_PATCE